MQRAHSDTLQTHATAGTGAGDVSHVVYLGAGRGSCNPAHMWFGSCVSPCESYPSYIPQFSWAPSGSDLSTTLQYSLLKATGASIVTSWGVRPERRVCFEKPRWPQRHPATKWFRTPAICAAFRRGVERAHSLTPHNEGSTRPRVVVALRGSSDRTVSDMDTMNIKGADVVKVVLGHTEGARTAEEQIRLVYSADAFVGMHGAAFALIALMRPGAIAGVYALLTMFKLAAPMLLLLMCTTSS
jgi:hypothetical protein